ncbi:thioredoxin [Weissella viridescens]|uniref:Thioredoxin n=2 Tax=Weissella viridescens TaxID=1629 RepID=A0A3P2RF12_WEIVI|nr:thioredoxin [Weissella viridescens]
MISIVVVILLGIGVGQYNHFVRAHRVVASENVKQAIASNKSVVFYRDDCPTCRKTLPLLLARNLVKQDLVLVNMNGQSNQHFKGDYHLKSVPTIVNKAGNYSDLTTDDFVDAIKAVEPETFHFSNSTDPTVK